MYILQDVCQFLLISFVILQYNPIHCGHGHHYPYYEDEEKPRRDEFVCNSGQCIDKVLICDGIAHCSDRSDETSKLCSKIGCPSFMYRCKYGACVKISSVCDGERNCMDDSDEPPYNDCRLPPSYFQTFGQTPTLLSTVKIPQTTKRYTPFQPVGWTQPDTTKPTPVRTPVTIRTSAIPTRTPSTPPRTPSTPPRTPSTPVQTAATPTQTVSTTVRIPPTSSATTSSQLGQCQLPEQMSETKYTINDCVSNSTDRTSSSRAGQFVSPATVLCIKCERENNTYENDEFTSFCLDGGWIPKIKPCKSCGILPTGKTNGNMPWQVAIYEKSLDRPACWGSVVSPYVVISAAHCFFDDTLNWKKDIVSFYAQVGKFDGKTPNQAQLYNITSVKFSQDGFQGSVTNFASDIAVVEISPSLQFDSDINQVCLGTTDSMANEKKTGSLSLYKPVQTNSLLEMETAPYLEYADCVNLVSTSFKELVTSDKICILNKATEKGNAGKGFYTQRNGESVQRLRGVISTTFTDTSTNRQVLTITDLTKHLTWINEMTDEINENRRTSETIDLRFPKDEITFPKKEMKKTRNQRPKTRS